MLSFDMLRGNMLYLIHERQYLNLIFISDCHRFTHKFISRDTDLQKSTDLLLNPFV